MTKAFYDETSRDEMERLRSRAIAERSGFTLDIRITTAKGRVRWIRLSADVECEEGVPVRIFGLKQDVTREKDLLARLQHLAEHDPLTGIANRGVFEARLAQADRRSSEDAPLAAVVLVDMDRFKQVNDTVGHAVGDECLAQLARDLIRSFAPGSLVARLGGDEFAVLLYGASTPAEVTRGVELLVARSRRTIARGARSLTISISVGIALADGAGRCGEAERLVHRADLALYAAKDAGRDGFQTFSAGVGDAMGEGCPQDLGLQRAVA